MGSAAHRAWCSHPCRAEGDDPEPPCVLPNPAPQGPAYLLSWACRSSSLDSICPGL